MCGCCPLRLLQRAELALEQRLDARALASDGQAHLLAGEPHAAVHHLEEGLALGLAARSAAFNLM